MATNITSSNGRRAADLALATAVQDALNQYTPIRVWENNIQVSAQGGTVVLSGSVRSVTMKEIADERARGVKGVSAVQNQLVVDAEIETAVAQALAADARTRAGFPGILVGVVFGVVYLKGNVASAEMKNAATEIASRVAGVRRVSNELLTPAPLPAAAAK